jgi:hypothetical protein
MKVAKVVRALESRYPASGARQATGSMIACLVPISVFGFAWSASRSRRSVEAWVTAAVVGTTAVICGSIVAIEAIEARS